jgi:signal transduction histidine kinase
MIIKASLRGLRSPGVGAEEIAEAAADIDHEVARLNRIVGDVLDFARPPRREMQPTDLHALCRDAAAAALAGEGATRLEVDLAPAEATIVTDPDRLRAALVNVLANAREAVASRGSGPPGGDGAPRGADPAAFDIRLEATSDGQGGAVIRVRDRGPGIEAADRPHVFEPYYTTKRTGTGLGLAIARNAILSLGGRIEVASTGAEGTEIRIELPASREEGAKDAPQSRG